MDSVFPPLPLSRAGYTSSQRGQHSSGAGGAGSSSSSHRDEAYDVAVQRARERAKTGARTRAGSQRAARQKIDVPSHSATLMKLGYPLAMLSIWAFNYFVFMQ
jgi:hypothetical protein